MFVIIKVPNHLERRQMNVESNRFPENPFHEYHLRTLPVNSSRMRDNILLIEILSRPFVSFLDVIFRNDRDFHDFKARGKWKVT